MKVKRTYTDITNIYIQLSLVKQSCLTPSSSRPCEPLRGLMKSDWVLRQAHGDAKLKKLAKKLSEDDRPPVPRSTDPHIFAKTTTVRI